MAPARDWQDQIVGLRWLVRDISERKRIEAERSRYAEQLQTLNAELAQRIQERTADLEAANQELTTSAAQMQALSANLLTAREDERTEMAREIHDELGQQLTGLKMELARLDKSLDQGAIAQLHTQTRALSELLDITIQTVRRIAKRLRPAVLDEFGLVAAIEWQLQEFQTRSGIAGHLTSSIDQVHLDSRRSIHLLRVFQEALTNIARHAQATQVDVTLSEQSGSLILQIRDNGLGISEQAMLRTQSLGLIGMRERARHLSGELEIQGIAGQGTTVTLKVPLTDGDANSS
jgi:signal transduction histidine kinase